MRLIKVLSVWVLAIIFCCALSNAVLANPISEVIRYTAKEDLKNSLKSRYGNSYSTIEMLLKAGMKAYDELCAIPDNSVNNVILRDLKDRYYPSFSTILLLYKSNKKSYDNLNK
jgi:hypothetical protein